MSAASISIAMLARGSGSVGRPRRRAARDRQGATEPAARASPAGAAGAVGPRARPWIAAGAIVLLTAAAHGPSVPGQFLWDDPYWIWANPVLDAGQAPWGYWWTDRTPDYLPVTSTFFWLQRQLWGERPENKPEMPYPALPYRAVNVGLHALGAVLVWRVLSALRLPGAWAGAALFAVHPVTVASAGWVAETKNTLSLVFYAAALLAYWRFDERGRWRLYGLSAGLFALALLTKTSTVVAPAVLAALLWWRGRKPASPRSAAALGGLFVLAATAGVVTLWYHSHVAIRGVDVGPPHGLTQRLLMAGKAMWFYALKSALPVRLNLIYPKWDLAKPDWAMMAALPALLAWSAALVVCRRRAWARPAAVATACFVFSLAPVLGLIDFSFMRFSYVSDHLAYLALPVLTATGAALVARLARHGRRRRIGVIAGASVTIALLGVLTARRAEVFANTLRLWTHTLEHNPGAWVAYNHAAVEHGLRKQYRRAEELLREALRLKSDYPDAYANLAASMVTRADYESAIRLYADALRLEPDNPDHHYWRGFALLPLKRLAEAQHHFERALAARPRWPEAHFQLAQVLAETKQHVRAAEHFRAAISLRPGYAAAMHNLGWLLATTEDDSVRDGREAARLAERVQRAGSTSVMALHMLRTAAYSEAGRPEQALSAARDALATAEKQGQTAQADEVRLLMEFYHRGQTYRDYKRARP